MCGIIGILGKKAPAAPKADPAPAPTERAAPAAPSARPAPTLPSEAQLGSDHPTMPNEGRPYGRHRDRFATMDTNGDGVISDEEREAAMKQRASDLRTRLDADGDGKLTVDELANAKGRMHFDDPKAVDTNHDGDISADELAAAMKARSDARRAQRGAGSGSSGGSATP